MTNEGELGKSPVEPTDYAGLQLDTRPEMERDRKAGAFKLGSIAQPYRSTWGNEKLVYAIMENDDPNSPWRQNGRLFPPIYQTKEELPGQSLPAHPKTLKRCYSRKRLFIIGGFLLAAVIAGAVLGGIFGSRRTSKTINATVTPTVAPSVINSSLPKSNVMVDSPLAPVAFETNMSSQGGLVPSYRLYYQSACGNAKEMIKQGVNAQWQTATPILTDLYNNSGIAVINYQNDSQTHPGTQSVMYYIGMEDLSIREKRQIGDQWVMGPLTSLKISVKGNSSTGGEGGWNGFRLAAAYTNRGARLFYHTSNETANWIQELIWFQDNDTWVQGTEFHDASPESHLTATMESASNTLRLFYATSSNTLSEQWLNLNSSEPEYQAGISMSSILAHPSSDIAAISTQHASFLYFTSSSQSAPNLTINELALPVHPMASPTSIEAVAVPALLASDTGDTVSSKFAPLGAVFSSSDQGGTITVIWAESVVDQSSGYGALKAVSRRVGDKWSAASYGLTEDMVDLPLGDNNADPH